MQRICDYVRMGGKYYIHGVTDTDKIFKTWDKLVAAYPVFDDKMKAYRARESGQASGRLLMYQNLQAPDKVHWFLLINGTEENLPEGEKWLDAEDARTRLYFTGYELGRVTREGVKKPVWTWKYSQERFQDLRDSMVAAIRSNRDHDFKIIIDKIFGTIGFSGSREQAKSLAKLAREEWKKRRPNDEMPEVPKGIGWIRRKSDKGIFLRRPKLSPPSKKERPLDTHVSKELLETLNQHFQQIDKESEK